MCNLTSFREIIIKYPRIVLKKRSSLNFAPKKLCVATVLAKAASVLSIDNSRIRDTPTAQGKRERSPTAKLASDCAPIYNAPCEKTCGCDPKPSRNQKCIAFYGLRDRVDRRSYC